MLGQSLQSLLNTYSSKIPTDFTDRFPGMRTKYIPRARLSLIFTGEGNAGTLPSAASLEILQEIQLI